MLGDFSSAAKNHQDALRIAIKMQTLYGQSIGTFPCSIWGGVKVFIIIIIAFFFKAVGNLGNLALLKGDFATAKTCFDQVLSVVLWKPIAVLVQGS